MDAKGLFVAPIAVLSVGVPAAAQPSLALLPSVLVRSVRPSPRVLAQRPNWQLFSSSSGRFRVMMPTRPEQLVEAVELPNDAVSTHYAFAADDEAGEYIVRYLDYPADLLETDPSQFLNGVKRGFLQGIPASERLNTQLSLAGYPGLEVEYVMADGNLGYARFYLVGNRLYQAIAMSRTPASERFSLDADRFFESFEVL